MLTIGLTIMVIGIGCLLGGGYGSLVFKDGRESQTSTVAGGFYVGAKWVVRLGLALCSLGLLWLATVGVAELAR